MSRQLPKGGRSFGPTLSRSCFTKRNLPDRNSTRRRFPRRSRNGSTNSCHHACSVRLAGSNMTIKACGSSHAFRTHGLMPEYGGLHQTLSPDHGCKSPLSTAVYKRGSLAFVG